MDKSKRDTRSYEIKKKLREQFPKGDFRVHKESGSFHIETDLLKEWTTENQQAIQDRRLLKSGEPITQAMTEAEKKRDFNEEMERKIKKAVKEYEQVFRDERGNILSGGNTYLFVECLK